MFGFDYRIECYSAAGHGTLWLFCVADPARGQLIGRLDARRIGAGCVRGQGLGF